MYAAIDIGSNTIQMMICRVQQGLLTERRNYLRTARLGAGDSKGNLTAEAIRFTAQTVADYMAIIDAAQVRQTRIIATSAVRDAANRDVLRQAIRRVAPTAPEIEIVSGLQEAALSFRGARASIAFPADWPVLDAGGSSSELIYEREGKIIAASADVGAVRAMKNGWDRREIKRRLQEIYAPILRPAKGCIGVAGTITAAAGWKLGLDEFQREPIEGVTLRYDEIEEMLHRLEKLPREQRHTLSPMLAQRGEIMAEGLWIWVSAMELLDVDMITVTGGGILDGSISELVNG